MISPGIVDRQEKQACILVVEYQPVLEALYHTMLGLAGYCPSSLPATQDITSLNWIEKVRCDPPALLLLDIDVAGREKVTFLSQLEQRWRACVGTTLPAILLTTDVRILPFLEKNYLVLIKPFHFSDLCKILEKACAHSSAPLCHRRA